jgi:hypothetical protein
MGSERFRRMGATTAAVGLVFALAACGGAETYTLDGAVVLRSVDDIAFDQSGDICAGAAGSGYDDLLGNQDLIVANGEGEILRETTLGPGQPSADGTECVFPWQVTELPEANEYFVVVGDREPVPYALDELRDNDFEINLVLEDPA